MEIKVGAKTVSLNSAQISVLRKLSTLRQHLEKTSQDSDFKKFFQKFFTFNFASQSIQIPSFYIYGRVGRGKSMLMMNFFHDLKLENKLYYHFNSFMQEVHKELHKLRKGSLKQDGLVEMVTDKIIGKTKLLCFDEFRVEDVVDAMILNKIFTHLFRSGVVLVITSNSHPRELYQNGLQRGLFLKFVREVLEKNCQIINLDNDKDYRGLGLGSIKRHYFYPNDLNNKKEVMELFDRVTKGKKPLETVIKTFGRVLKINNSCEEIALFDFDELCVADLGIADYQAICRNFRLIFLLNVPKLQKEDCNEAKRLTLFIDEAYENKVELVVLSEVQPEEIYLEGIGREAFRRTASRLNEVTILSSQS